MLTGAAAADERRADLPAQSGLKKDGWSYLAILAIVVLTLGLTLVAVAASTLISIPLASDPVWYRDYGGRKVPEIADQDLFYQNLGPSIDSARLADIVIFGPSFSSYAFDRDVLRAFGNVQRLKTFNMSFIGIRGGEFSRRVVTRWNVHAPLWIINVDDQFTPFFSDSTDLTLGPRTEPITALRLSRPEGFARTVGRTLRWRIEDVVAWRQTGQMSPVGIYRNSQNGNMLLDVNPRYLAQDNKPLVISRDPDCHTTPEVIAAGRRFLASVGGEVVLTLVPHSQYCPTQARELAQALGVDLILVPPDGMTTVDGGGHLDKRSATIFSTAFMAQLVQTAAFRKAFGSRPAPADPAASASGTTTATP